VLRDDISRFVSALADTPGMWVSVNHRTLALWIGGRWHNLVSTIQLDHRPKDAVPIFDRPPDGRNGVLGAQQILPITSLVQLLASLRLRGRARFGDREVWFLRRGRTKNEMEPYDHGNHIFGWELNNHIRGPYLKGHLLSIYGGSVQEILEDLPGGIRGVNKLLRREGWQDLNELLALGLGDMGTISENNLTRITITAPLPVELEGNSCTFSGSRIRYTIVAASRSGADHATITVGGQDREGSRIGIQTPAKGGGWRRHPRGYVRSGSIRVRPAERVRLSLNVGNHEVSDLILISTEEGEDTRERVPVLRQAHEILFPSKRSFEEVLLRPLQTEGREFERAVAKLFEYCGCVSDHPGQTPGEQNGPDILVYHRERNILLVIETTVKHLLTDDRKLYRLAKRANDVRVEVRHTGVEVVSCFVIPWSREVIPPGELREAEENDARVICREDLEILLSFATADSPSDRVFSYFVPLPPTEKPKRWRLAGDVNPRVQQLFGDD
jgi:hypothetical protein